MNWSTSVPTWSSVVPAAFSREASSNQKPIPPPYFGVHSLRWLGDLTQFFLSWIFKLTDSCGCTLLSYNHIQAALLLIKQRALFSSLATPQHCHLIIFLTPQSNIMKESSLITIYFCISQSLRSFLQYDLPPSHKPMFLIEITKSTGDVLAST